LRSYFGRPASILAASSWAKDWPTCPVQQPNQILTGDAKVAKALKLDIPPKLLALTDEAME
jgi:hypothetical protein